MRKYFVNPELKLSSGILLFLMTAFLLIELMVLKIHHNNLKEEYINNIGAIAIRVIEKNPELEKHIIPIIAKEQNEQETKAGALLLSKYGITQRLETGLFPYVNRAALKDYTYIFCIFVFLAASLFFLNWYQYRFFYDRIRKLTLGAKRVVEGDYELTINENREGDLSKLAVSFNSMKEVIRKNLSDLSKEKQFLVDLLSDISHQLKTPLSAMIVYNDIMIGKELTDEQRRTFLVNSQNQLSRMQWLIHSMLKLAKLDARAIELNKETIGLKETLQEAVDSLENKACERFIGVKVSQGEDILFCHDRLWLQEAFINIIKNGIEHTPAYGEINIELIENPIYRRVIIKDNGEGISEEDLPNIFKRFYKAKNSRKHDSIGIGLALSKAIIEAHKGVIEVTSKVGEGTSFIITFLKYL